MWEQNPFSLPHCIFQEDDVKNNQNFLTEFGCRGTLVNYLHDKVSHVLDKISENIPIRILRSREKMNVNASLCVIVMNL